MNRPIQSALCALLCCGLSASCADDKDAPEEGCFWQATADDDAGGGVSEGTCGIAIQHSDRLSLGTGADATSIVSRPRLYAATLPVGRTTPFSLRAGDSTAELVRLSLLRVNATNQVEGRWVCGGADMSGQFTVRVEKYDYRDGEVQTARVVIDGECTASADPTLLGGTVKLHLELTRRIEEK